MSFGAGLNIGVRDTLSVAKYKTDRDNAERRNRLAELQFDYTKQRDGVRDAQFDQNLAHNQEVHIFNKRKFEETLALNKSADARANKQEARDQGEYDRGVAEENAANAMSVVSVLDAKYDGDENAIANSPEYLGAVSNLLGDTNFRAGVAHLAGLGNDVEDVISTQNGFIARTADGKEKLIPNDIMIKATLMNGAANGALNNADLLRNMQQEAGNRENLIEGLKTVSQGLEEYAASNQSVEGPPEPIPLSGPQRKAASDIYVARTKLAEAESQREGSSGHSYYSSGKEIKERKAQLENLYKKHSIFKDADDAELERIFNEEASKNFAADGLKDQAGKAQSRADKLPKANFQGHNVTAPLVKQAKQKADKIKLGKLQLDRLMKVAEDESERSRKDSLSAAASYLALAKQNGVTPDMDTAQRLLSGDFRSKAEIAADKAETTFQNELFKARDKAVGEANKKAVTETYTANKALLENTANAIGTRMYGPDVKPAQIKALESHIHELALSSEYSNAVDMNDFYGADQTAFAAVIRAVEDAILRKGDDDRRIDEIETVAMSDSNADILKAAQGKGGILETLPEEEGRDLFMTYLEKAGGDPRKAVELLEEASRG